MNAKISELFDVLGSSTADMQREIALSLSMLLEHCACRKDSTQESILTADLLAIELSPPECAELARRIQSALSMTGLHRDAQITFVTALGKIKDPPSFRAISKYVQAYYNVLSDEELYGVLVSLSSALLYKHPSPDILGIAREHQINGVVRQLSLRSSARLEEPLRRLRAALEN